MFASLQTWWNDHSRAERALMAALGVALLIVILWLGVWRPVEDGLAAGWERQGAALDRYGAVRSEIEALKRLPIPANAGVSADQLVSQSAAEAGFTLERVGAPGGNRLSVSIASARTGPLLEWLGRLEAQGIAIQSINIVPGTTEGTVAVQAVFQGAGQ